MQKPLLSFFLVLLLVSQLFAQQNPKREMRGAWIATYANIDWPVRSQSVNQQKTALLQILDDLVSAGHNTFYIQVRSQCDAMYYSTLEPWSADLTGTQGQAPNPFWDPMQFAIDECHKRGVEFHAWLNPYRAIGNYNVINTFSASHVARQHPEWLLAAGNLRTLDPGIPQVRSYILDIVKDIVNRYDVDGVHFDDYFYPSASFDDSQTFASHNRGFSNVADWRRDNVNLMIESVFNGIKSLKPWVKFGVSPSGIYRNSTNPSVGTPTSGMEHYTTLYADSKKWIQQGWVDYLAPQVYWYIGQSGADYSKIIPWWNDNAFGRNMFIGLAGYKVNDPSQNTNWANPSQIPNQIKLNRSAAYSNIKGQAVYNTTSIRSSNTLGFKDSLKNNYYKTIALQPLLPWRDDVAPAAPSGLQGSKFGTDSLVLSWNVAPAVSNELDKVRQYVVYKSATTNIDFNNPQNIIGVVNADKNSFTDKNINANNYYYAITALDRLSNESISSNQISTLTTSIPPSQNMLSGLIVYPNPLKTYLEVYLNGQFKKEVIVSLMNLSGKEVYKTNRNIKGENIRIEFEEKLKSGVYVLSLVGDEGIYYQKIVIE